MKPFDNRQQVEPRINRNECSPGKSIADNMYTLLESSQYCLEDMYVRSIFQRHVMSVLIEIQDITKAQ